MKIKHGWTLVGRALAGLCVWGMCLGAEARQWTNDKGVKIEAEYVSSDGKDVVLLLNGNIGFSMFPAWVMKTPRRKSWSKP